MKTLYLDGARELRVMRDGPALRVRASGASDRFFPFCRITGVVVSGRVEWQIDALLACADAHVPVSFLTGHGHPRARLLGASVEHDPLGMHDAFIALLERDDGRDRYGNWIRAQVRRAVLEHIRSGARSRGEVPRLAAMRRLMEQRLRPYVRLAELRRFDRQVHGLVATRMEPALRRAGLDLEAGLSAALGVCPVRDFADIATLYLLAIRRTYIKHLGMRARRRGEERASLNWGHAVAFVEAAHKQVDDHARRLLLRLHAFCLEARHDHGDS